MVVLVVVDINCTELKVFEKFPIFSRLITENKGNVFDHEKFKHIYPFINETRW